MPHFQGFDGTDAEKEAYKAMCRLKNDMYTKNLEIEDKNDVIQELEAQLKLAKIERSQLRGQLTDLRKELKNQEKTLEKKAMMAAKEAAKKAAKEVAKKKQGRTRSRT